MTRHALAQHAPGARSSRSARTAASPRDGRPPPSCTRSAWKGRWAGWPSSSRRATASSSNGSGTSPPTTSPGCRAASRPSSGAIRGRTARPSSARRLKALRRRQDAPDRAPPGAAAAVDRRGPGRLRRLGLHAALAFERDNAAPAVARRWARFLAWHPSLPFFWPDRARQARAQAGRVDGQGRRGPGRQRHRRARPARRAGRAQGRGPAPRPGDPQGRGRPGPGAARRALERGQAEASAPGDEPEKPLAAVRQFLRDFPERPAAPRPSRCSRPSRARRPPARPSIERQVVDDLVRSEALPDADFRDLIDRARQFLAEHPESQWRRRGRARLDDYVRKLDDARHREGPAVSRSSTRPTSRPGSSGTRTT